MRISNPHHYSLQIITQPHFIATIGNTAGSVTAGVYLPSSSSGQETINADTSGLHFKTELVQVQRYSLAREVICPNWAVWNDTSDIRPSPQRLSSDCVTTESIPDLRIFQTGTFKLRITLFDSLVHEERRAARASTQQIEVISEPEAAATISP